MIELESGRNIDVLSIDQERTCAGVLAGDPGKHHNDKIIERCRRQAIEKYGQHVIIIDPIRKPGPPVRSEHGDKMWGPSECLPQITCYCLFRSGPVRNEPEDYSVLLLVWFQNTFAFPIDAGVVARIREVDWETSALNWTV